MLLISLQQAAYFWQGCYNLMTHSPYIVACRFLAPLSDLCAGLIRLLYLYYTTDQDGIATVISKYQ